MDVVILLPTIFAQGQSIFVYPIMLHTAGYFHEGTALILLKETQVAVLVGIVSLCLFSFLIFDLATALYNYLGECVRV